MIIALGCDHVVTDTKIKISDYIKHLGHQVLDVGTYDFTRTHYPIFAKKVAEAVAKKEADLGITLCGTGVGITAAANKNIGVRSALVTDVASTVYARQQLDANIIGFGGKIVGENLIFDIIEAFIKTVYVPTQQNQKWIQKINALAHSVLPEQTGNDHFFDDEIEKWRQGYYQDHVESN